MASKLNSAEWFSYAKKEQVEKPATRVPFGEDLSGGQPGQSRVTRTGQGPSSGRPQQDGVLGDAHPNQSPLPHPCLPKWDPVIRGWEQSRGQGTAIAKTQKDTGLGSRLHWPWPKG